MNNNVSKIKSNKEIYVRIATWNINSVRLRLNQVLRFIQEKQIDIICLQ